MNKPILRCKRRKANGEIVDGCGWQGEPERGDMCPSCGGLILRVVSLAGVDREEFYGFAASAQAEMAQLRQELTDAAEAANEQQKVIELLIVRQTQHAMILDGLGWWVRGLAGVVTMVVIALAVLATGCGGERFTAAAVDQAGAAGAAGEPSSLPGSAGSGGAPGAAGSSGGMPVDAGAAGAAGEAPSAPQPCPRSGWVPSAFASYSDRYGGPPGLALDGDDGSRWTGGTAQAAGQWFQIELSAAAALEVLIVASVQIPSEAPSRIALVLDGEPAPATVRELRPGTLEVRPAEVRASRVVRLQLLEERPSWWSIDELTGWCGAL